MTSAKKCDRCGQLYETWFPNKKNEAYQFRDNIIKIGTEGDWWNYDLYDLCPECYKKLVKFMKMED